MNTITFKEKNMQKRNVFFLVKQRKGQKKVLKCRHVSKPVDGLICTCQFLNLSCKLRRFEKNVSAANQ